MKTSWKIATFFNIPIRLHISMGLVPLIFGGFLADSPVVGLLAIALLFGSVVAHELGHALVARRYGIRAENITLTPIGGIAMFRSLPTQPGPEIAIALAGPVVSLAIAGIAYVLATPLIYLAGQSATAATPVAVIVYTLFISNLFLGLFNLIPALPMDGGRVLRGLLAKRHGHLRATITACKVSRALAAVGFAVGLLQWQVTWMAIAAFVYLSSRREEMVARVRAGAQSPFAGSPFAGIPFGVHPASSTSTRSPGAGQQDPFGPHWRGQPAEDARGPNQAGAHEPRREPIVVNGGRAEVIRRNDPTNPKT